MSNVWITSDSHFGHRGVCNFLNNDGTKLRPWDNPDDMDEAMIELWNSKVKPNDKVYHLGDVVINRRCLKTLPRLNGDKVLIKGNHDIFRINEYLEHFREVRAYHVMNGIIFSHIPIHPASLERFGVNAHGHTHSNQVMTPIGFDQTTGEIIYSDIPDPKYFCVCVEQTDFAPISLEDLKQRIIARGGSIEMKQGNR